MSDYPDSRVYSRLRGREAIHMLLVVARAGPRWTDVMVETFQAD